MIIDKEQFWDRVVDYYYDEVHWEKGYTGIYEWLEAEYGAISDTGSKVLRFKDGPKATWFCLKYGV